jgi:hypothetical protein
MGILTNTNGNMASWIHHNDICSSFPEMMAAVKMRLVRH